MAVSLYFQNVIQPNNIFGDKAMMSGWDVAKQVARFVPLAGLVMEGAERAAIAVNEASGKSLNALRDEVAKQEIRLKFELQQAKIAQELAIAQRIVDAETVEIEEFYDRSGKGELGAKLEGEVASFGFGVDGKSVTKRIYKFKGRNGTDDGPMSQITE
jgi:hypothetical protein